MSSDIKKDSSSKINDYEKQLLQDYNKSENSDSKLSNLAGMSATAYTKPKILSTSIYSPPEMDKLNEVKGDYGYFNESENSMTKEEQAQNTEGKTIDLPVSKEEQEFLDVKKYKKNDVCCIIGFAGSWKEAPYDRKDVDFWGLNDLFVYTNTLKQKPNFNLWFEVHNIKESPSKQGKHHQEFLQNCKIPIITQKHWDKYPMSQPYPRNYVKSEIAKGFTQSDVTTAFNDYSNQISWMIALAIMMNYKEIMVYGVDMAQKTEYEKQKPSCNFFLGCCWGRGIKLTIPASCELCTGAPDYGFSTDNPNRYRTKEKIKDNEETIIRFRQRQAEIEFQRSRNNQEWSDNNFKCEMDNMHMNEDIKALEQEVAVYKALHGCISSLPLDINTINKRKPGLIQNCQVKADNALSRINFIKKQMEEMLAKNERRRRDHFVYNKMLDDEFKDLEMRIEHLKGRIGAKQHDLDNNLV